MTPTPTTTPPPLPPLTADASPASPAPPEARYPGPASKRMLDEMQRYVRYDPWPFVVDIERSEGMYLATVDGQRVFDWAGYYGSKLVGHNHPRLCEAAYLQRLIAAANNKVANPDFLTPQCLDYYRLLYRLAPAAMRSDELEVYVVNSGAEAMENMLKYFLSLHYRRHPRGGEPGQGAARFIYFEEGFHGRTVYTLNITQTQDPIATRDFHGLTAAQNVAVPFPAIDSDAPAAENAARTDAALAEVEAILQRHPGGIAGIVVEPVQGAGGQRVAEPRFFQGLSELAHQYGTSLGFDEVQTSAGPTGRVFASERFDLPHAPQAIAVGKKFGLGALYMRETLPDVGVLDSTWGGNLADMVRFAQEWDIVETERLLPAAETNGRQLAAGLRELQRRHPAKLRNVRGMGLYQGFTVPDKRRRSELMEMALQKHDLLLLGAGRDSIRTRPNLSVTPAEIERFLGLLDAALAAV